MNFKVAIAECIYRFLRNFGNRCSRWLPFSYRGNTATREVTSFMNWFQREQSSGNAKNLEYEVRKLRMYLFLLGRMW